MWIAMMAVSLAAVAGVGLILWGTVRQLL